MVSSHPILVLLALFGFASSDIVFIYPDVDNIVSTSDNVTFQWTSLEPMPAVKLTLWNADTPSGSPYVIADNYQPILDTFYQFFWDQVNITLPTGSNYYLTVTGTNEAGQHIAGLSKLFGIRNVQSNAGGAAGALSFLQPQSSTNVIANQPFNILWATEGFVAQDQVTITLFRVPADSTTSGLEQLFDVATFMFNTGVFQWQVPKYLGTTDYLYLLELSCVVGSQTFRSRSPRFAIVAQ